MTQEILRIESVTLGITALFSLRVLIDELVCDLDVGFGPPGRSSSLQGSVCSTVKAQHDLSSVRCKTGQFLSTNPLFLYERNFEGKGNIKYSFNKITQNH